MSDNNPYTPPQSNVYQPESSNKKSNPDWEIGQILNEAWAGIHGFKLTYILASLVYLAISLGIGFAIELISSDSAFVGALGQILIMLITYPLTVGLMMISIKHVRGEAVQPGMIFDYYPQTIPIFLLYLLMSILIVIGFILLVLPGIYLAFAYAFAAPLLVDKKLGIWQALETSRKAVTQCWFRFFFLMIIMTVVIIISAIPLLIGLIWTIPMIAVALGLVYRDILDAEL